MGPIRDAERLKKKHEEHLLNDSTEAPVLTPQQEARKAEYELQKKLQTEYQKVQDIDPSTIEYGPSKTLPPTATQ